MRAPDDSGVDYVDLDEPLEVAAPVDVVETDELPTGTKGATPHEELQPGDVDKVLPEDPQRRTGACQVLGFSCVPYGSAALATYAVGSTGVRVSLRREVAPLLVGLLADFHATVESLNPRSCWGHAPRAIAGTSVPSRHWPGIAVDANAAEHPMGKSNTFTAGERAAIARLLSKYRHQGHTLFRWGGQYTGRKDDMHFELDAPHAVCVSAVAALQSPPKPAPRKPPAGGAPGSRVLRLTAPVTTGADVRFVQTFIGPHRCGPADGQYGNRTEAGVEWYQRMRGITADGVVGKTTWRQMGVTTTL